MMQKKISESIKQEFKGEQIYPLIAKKMMNNVSNGIENLTLYIKILIIFLYILSFVVLFVSFSSIFNERRNEFAMMRVIGATKGTLSFLAAMETFIISFIASFLGTLLALFLIILFDKAIIASLKMPYLSPSILWTALCALGTFFLISLVAPIAALKTIFDITKNEIALSVKAI